jgi:hypothetical protein
MTTPRTNLLHLFEIKNFNNAVGLTYRYIYACLKTGALAKFY